MQVYESFIKNNLLVLAGQLLVLAQSLIMVPIVIKTVGVEIYGGYVLLITLVGFICGISTFGVGFRCSRFLPSVHNFKDRTALFYPQFNFQFLTIIFLAVFIIYFYPLLDKLFLKGDVVFCPWLVLPYFIFYFVYWQAGNYFRYTHRIGLYNFATVSFAVLNIAIIFLYYACRIHLTVNILFSIQIGSSFLVALPLMLLMAKEIGFRATLPNITNLINDIKLGFPLVLSYIVDVILSSSDRYLLTAFLSVAAVGFYNPGYALGSLLVLLPKICGVVLPPFLSQAVDSGNESDARTMFDYTVKGFLLIAIPFCAGCALLGKPLLALLANAEVAQNGSLVAFIVALGTVFYGLEFIIGNLLFVQMRTAAILNINVMAALLNLLLNLVLLYYFRNILVAALTTFFSYLVAFIFIYRVAARFWPIDFGWKIILKSVGASLLMALALYGISAHLGVYSYKAGYLFGEIALGIIIYCLGLFGLKTFSSKELVYLKKALSLS